MAILAPRGEHRLREESALGPGDNSWFLGGRCDNFSNFEGRLDEIAIYGRALSAGEVAAHFKAGGLPPPATAFPDR